MQLLSPASTPSGPTHASSSTLAPPPTARDSRRIKVSLESRNGTWAARRFSAAMTLPSVDSEELIEAASRRRVPSAPDLDTRSDPAKSTRFTTEVKGKAGPPVVLTPRTTEVDAPPLPIA